ncbi:transposase [Microvirga roseola]|uniref:transposase n=1 Tax=Microvirga roseola TaxID=2883126 RepID=UPI001E2ED435|nr:transposase [Microvirga roseola]
MLQVSRSDLLAAQGLRDPVPRANRIIESFFARVRRAYRGVHHRFSVKYLDWYIAELSWREDHSRLGNRAA